MKNNPKEQVADVQALSMIFKEIKLDQTDELLQKFEDDRKITDKSIEKSCVLVELSDASNSDAEYGSNDELFC